MNRMKTLSAFFLAALVLVSCTNNDTTPDLTDDLLLAIPDARFETILIDLGIDSDGVINQQMLKTDAAGVSRLVLEFEGGKPKISDLTGIEGFTNLKLLAASRHDITNIDLSANILLDSLYLTANILTSIDLSNNPNLILVDLGSNGIQSIKGLSELSQLKMLNLSSNDLEDFAIQNESIEVLFMSHNLLKTIDVSGALNLTNILLTTNQIETIDLSANTLLETLLISDNKLVDINLTQNNKLTHLWISSNSLTNLDVSNLQELIHLTVHQNENLSCVKIESGQFIPTVTKSDHQELNSNCN